MVDTMQALRLQNYVRILAPMVFLSIGLLCYCCRLTSDDTRIVVYYSTNTKHTVVYYQVYAASYVQQRPRWLGRVPVPTRAIAFVRFSPSAYTRKETFSCVRNYR